MHDVTDDTVNRAVSDASAVEGSNIEIIREEALTSSSGDIPEVNILPLPVYKRMATEALTTTFSKTRQQQNVQTSLLHLGFYSKPILLQKTWRHSPIWLNTKDLPALSRAATRRILPITGSRVSTSPLRRNV